MKQQVQKHEQSEAVVFLSPLCNFTNLMTLLLPDTSKSVLRFKATAYLDQIQSCQRKVKM